MKLHDCLIFTTAILIASATATGVLAQSAESEIRATGAAWEEAYTAGNVDELMQHYAEDAVSMAPGFPASVGKSAVRESLSEFLTEHKVDHETHVQEIIIENGLAVERAEYVQTAAPRTGDGDVLNEVGKHIVVYQRGSDAKWRIRAEIWNSNQ